MLRVCPLSSSFSVNVSLKEQGGACWLELNFKTSHYFNMWTKETKISNGYGERHFGERLNGNMEAADEGNDQGKEERKIVEKVPVAKFIAFVKTKWVFQIVKLSYYLNLGSWNDCGNEVKAREKLKQFSYFKLSSPENQMISVLESGWCWHLIGWQLETRQKVGHCSNIQSMSIMSFKLCGVVTSMASLATYRERALFKKAFRAIPHRNDTFRFWGSAKTRQPNENVAVSCGWPCGSGR